MKKALMLFTLGVLSVVACQKTPAPETPAPDPEETTESKDASLQGTEVDVKWLRALDVKKVFVLNEGQLGANNATLDFLRVSDGRYVTGAFKKMNPGAQAGLGDVGNDIALHNDEVWMVINNSGLVEVVSAADETEIAVVEIPTPRAIAFDDNYAYVTSWAGAFTTYGADYTTITDSANPKGCVYRVDLKTYKTAGSVEVGYQPEGIAYYDGKLYVANSGGISSRLAPNYAYDNTVSVIDAASFKVTETIEVQVNLKNAYADTKGNIYVTSLGNYYDVHSGLYRIDSAGKADKVADNISAASLCGDILYCLGTDSEWDWNLKAHDYRGFTVSGGTRSNWDVTISGSTLFSLCVIDGDNFLVGDVGQADYVNPGSVACYHKGSKLWSVTAGVCPGHFAVWK